MKDLLPTHWRISPRQKPRREDAAHLTAGAVSAPSVMALAAVMMASVLLSGCVEIAYKRGAGEDELIAARAACARSTGKENEECMARQGWSVYQPDDPRLNLALVPNGDNRSEASRPATRPLESSELVPDKTYEISSWWRFGGNGEGLKADAATCAAHLGIGNELQPRPGGGYLARGALVKCLKDIGWRGLPQG